MNLSKLAERYSELTGLESKIIEYVMSNPEKIVHLTANELAEILYVSKTSVINLSKKLGFAGYSELRYYVKDYIQHKKKKEHILSFKDILDNIHDEVTKTLALQSEDNIKTIIKRIINSKLLYIVARGASEPIADMLSSRLALLKIRSILIRDPNLIEVLGDGFDKEETLFVISLSGETEKILTITKAARARGIDVIALTSFSSNSLQRLANYNMFCFADDTKTKYNDLISRIGLHTLTHILITYMDMYREE